MSSISYQPEISSPNSWYPILFLKALGDSFPMQAELVHDTIDEAHAESRSGGC